LAENLYHLDLNPLYNPLLVSVRSGAKVSMPGMMETVLNVGLNNSTREGLIKKTGNPRFVYDSQRRLIQMYSDVVMEKAAGIEPKEGKGVRIQLYHETMANTHNYLAQVDSAFRLMNKLGIRTAKIGHVGQRLDRKEYHYSQYGVNYYRNILKKAANIKSEIVIAGVLNKIEIWPKEKYEYDLESFLGGKDGDLAQMTEEAFALLDERDEGGVLSPDQQEEYEQI